LLGAGVWTSTQFFKIERELMIQQQFHRG